MRFDLLDEFPSGGKAIGVLRLVVEALLYIIRKAIEAAFPKQAVLVVFDFAQGPRCFEKGIFDLSFQLFQLQCIFFA